MSEPTVTEILSRVDARLKELALSDREASIRATGKPDAIRELRRGKRPSDMRIRLLAEALQTSVGYLRGSEDEDDPRIEKPHNSRALLGLGEDDDAGDLSDIIPLYRAVDGGLPRGFMEVLFHKSADVMIIKTNEPPSSILRPRTIRRGSSVFGVSVFVPRHELFEPAEIFLVDPDAQPKPGDDVLIRLKPPADVPPYQWYVTVRRLRKITADEVEVGMRRSLKTAKIRRDLIKSIMCIIPTSSVLRGY